MRRGTTKAGALLLLLCALLLAACGGDDDGNGAAGSGEGSTEGATAIAADAAEGASGEVTMCVPKDVSGAYTKTVKQFNKEGGGVTVKLLELPEEADQQRQQLIQRQRAKSPECDVLGIDVIWTAEFANQGWVADVTNVVDQRGGEFIESTIETARWDDKYWALPYNSNAGLMYYRSDQVDSAPQTWQEAYEQAKANDGIVYQGAPYEGLTVDFLEILYSAGGSVLSDDGKSSEADSQTTRDVLQFMVDGVGDAAPKAVVTYNEESARRAFEGGRATLMRNWPYAFALGNQSDIKGKFDITTLPGYDDQPGAGVLGGTNLAISAFSKNPGGALAVLNYFTGEEGQQLIGEGATPPATTAAYDIESVRKAIGLPDEIRDAVGQAQPRPVSPVYTQISQAIYENVNKALSGSMGVDEAVSQMDSDIEKALATF